MQRSGWAWIHDCLGAGGASDAGRGARALLIVLLAASSPSLAMAQQKATPAQQKAAANAAPAAANQTFLLGTFGEWKALMSGKDKAKICYVLSQPKDRKPAGLKRDPAYAFISTRLADGTRNEVAFKLGFAGKPNADGSLSVGSAKFALLASDESVFLKNPAQEGQLLEAMKKASELTVKVQSLRGNETTDRYSLDGFAKALERMAKECP